jgi:hypothetical protein
MALSASNNAAQALTVGVVQELQFCLKHIIQAHSIQQVWQHDLLTKAMIIYLFTLNQEITLPSAHLIASDPIIFSHLLKFYLSLLF